MTRRTDPTAARLEARNLVVRIDESDIVAGVSLLARAGEVTALVGPNGAGKSTLFDCLSGVLPAASGEILLDGSDVTLTTPDARARRGLARTFQHSSVFPTLTVEENLLVGAEHRARLGLLRALVRRGNDERTPDVVEQIIARLGLAAVRHATSSTLPTGTLRLVELGRALCTRPTVLMLDEPASGLDDVETDRLRSLLLELVAEGLAVLLVEHDLVLVRDVADRVYALAEGRIIREGATDDVLADQDVMAVVTGKGGVTGNREGREHRAAAAGEP